MITILTHSYPTSTFLRTAPDLYKNRYWFIVTDESVKYFLIYGRIVMEIPIK